MEEFWILIFVSLFATTGSVKLELKTFDEIFGEGWWDKTEAEDLKTPPPTNFGQNVHHQIGQNESNSTDQLGQIEPNLTDQLGQIEPNSTDQNPPLAEFDHFDKSKNVEENFAEDEQKRKVIGKFHAIKDEFKKIGKYSVKERNQIENKIAKHLKVSRKKIYKWKKELGLSQKWHNFEKKKNERKHLVEKFDQMKAELKRDGFKNSYKNQIDETVAKELGLSFKTIYRWKRELFQTKSNKHSHSEQLQLMKRYYEIKDKNPAIRNVDIAKRLKIGKDTLYKWKKQFKRQQLHPNSVDGISSNCELEFGGEHLN